MLSPLTLTLYQVAAGLFTGLDPWVSAHGGICDIGLEPSELDRALRDAGEKWVCFVFPTGDEPSPGAGAIGLDGMVEGRVSVAIVRRRNDLGADAPLPRQRAEQWMNATWPEAPTRWPVLVAAEATRQRIRGMVLNWTHDDAEPPVSPHASYQAAGALAFAARGGQVIIGPPDGSGRPSWRGYELRFVSRYALPEPAATEDASPPALAAL